MPCQLPLNKIKRKWERDQSANALPENELGYALGQAIAHDWWAEWSQTQTADIWLWMNGGRILQPQTFHLPPLTGVISYRELLGARGIAMEQEGYSTEQFSGGGPWSLKVTCRINTFQPAVPPVNVEFATTGTWLAPNGKLVFNFIGLTQVDPPFPPFSGPNGFLTITPLRRCHTCTNP